MQVMRLLCTTKLLWLRDIHGGVERPVQRLDLLPQEPHRGGVREQPVPVGLAPRDVAGLGLGLGTRTRTRNAYAGLVMHARKHGRLGLYDTDICNPLGSSSLAYMRSSREEKNDSNENLVHHACLYNL